MREYYPAFKKEGLLAHATTWMNFEYTVINPMNHHKKINIA
jgi:hypothetical protein